MAIIKCPECGHQISDRAPVCPSCGVEIAGKITRCPQCGEIYFKDQDVCPNCHHANFAAHDDVTTDNTASAASVVVPGAMQQYADNTTDNSAEGEKMPAEPKKKSHAAFIISFVLALIVCAVCFYFYNQAKTSKETEAYEYAMTSSDPLVLQSYLDTYKDGSRVHRDSIQHHLNYIKQIDRDWQNAVASNSKAMLEDYIKKYPNSHNKVIAQRKIDSIDWALAVNLNTIESYNEYAKAHPYGEHVDQANDKAQELNIKIVQPEEKEMVASVFRRFFQSINSRDENALSSTVSDFLTSFLGKQEASKSDVVSYMFKIWKDDIKNMNWRIMNDYKIEKKPVGEEMEYVVQFTATQKIDREDVTKETEAKYRIKSKIGPEQKITEFNMTKLAE